jgi:PAS domain S-box-containing protein
MKIREPKIGIKGQHLPQFAYFILHNFLTEICVDQLRLSRQFNLPLLKFLSRFSDDEILEISKVSVAEFLTSLIENKSFEFIKESLDRWIADQLEVVGKFEVQSNDITLINYIRAVSLKHYASQYTTDIKMLVELMNEIDLFFLNFNTAGMDTYVAILKDRLIKETEFNAKLTNALPGMVYIFDLATQKEVYANRKGYNILGYTDEQVRTSPSDFFRSLIHPDDLQVMDDFYKTYETEVDGTVRNYEYRVRNVQDEYCWLRHYVLVFSRNEVGKPKEVIGLAFDVTGEKRLTETLAQRENQLLEAQAIAHIGSYEWNIVENTSSNTPETYKIFELGMAGKFESFMAHVHPDDIETVKAAIENSFNTGIYECEYRYVAGGKEKVIWTKGNVTIKDGVPHKMIGTIQDITERKRIETDLLIKSQQLEQSNESLQHFASVASHDLKEPLRRISLLSEKIYVAEKDKMSSVSADNFIKIRTAATRMQKMIDDILAYSSLNVKEEKSETSLQALLDDVTDIFEYLITEKNATVTSDGLPDAVVIPSQMRQLFQNLIGNSLKFSQVANPPQITVTHKWIVEERLPLQKEKSLEITIKDNGIGFSPDDAVRIFGLFSRLNNRSAYAGSGIGLAICKRIVENHDGSITASSEPGKGAGFTILLPQ